MFSILAEIRKKLLPCVQSNRFIMFIVQPSSNYRLITQSSRELQHHVIREKRLSEKETLVIFYNVVKIVERLHARNVVHRDLKLGNVSTNTEKIN